LLAGALSAAQAETSLDDADRYAIHNFLAVNTTKIGAELMVQPKRADWPTTSPLGDPNTTKTVWGDITETLIELGDPRNAEPDLPFLSLGPQEYLQSIEENALQRAPDPKPWRSVFFRVEATQVRTSSRFVLPER